MKVRASFNSFALALIIAFTFGGRLYAQDDDFGDAPDPTYPTLQVNGGAQHGVGALTIGTAIDVDPDGQPTVGADGDDILDGSDDEDGVWFPNTLIPGVPYAINVTLNGVGAVPAYLQGWIDFDGNGSWGDPGEQIITDMPAANTLFVIPFNVPPWTASGKTYARFRLSTQMGLPDNGYVADGEVEDYALDIDPIKWLQPPNLTETGVDVDTDVELADDWLCNASGPVSDIHIWGSFLDDFEEVPLSVLTNMSFLLKIYSDIPANPQGGIPYSMPGTLLWSQPFNPGQYQAGLRIPVPDGEWWHNPNALPPNDWIPQADFNCYQFDFYPQPGEEFVQTNGMIYWLGLQMLTQPDPWKFGWKSTDYTNHWNDDAVWWDGNGWQELIYGGTPPNRHPYADLAYPSNSMDLSFAISTPDEEEEYDHKMHWPQLPDPHGWDVRACLVPGTDQDPETRKVLADDFQCASNGFINHITFWGSWYSNMFDEADFYQGITNIHLSIHSDIPAGQGPHEWSQPGQLLWARDFDPHNPPAGWMLPDPYEEEPSDQGWYDPNTEFFEFNNHNRYFRYEIYIPNSEAFEQDEGNIYWLDISVETVWGLWGWKTSRSQHYMDDAVWADLPITNLDQWIELRDPETGVSLDLAFIINEVEQEDEYDFGDAPDWTAGTGPGEYETRLLDNGAYHNIVAQTPYFDDGSGSDQPDGETDGQPDPNALGDDNLGTSPDDEDGIAFPAPPVVGQNSSVDITVDDGLGGTGAGGGYVDAWIDFNADGDWIDPNEQIFSGWANQGLTNVAFLVPASAANGWTFARFRITSVSTGLLPTGGPAPDGEVEDHEVFIEEAPKYLDYGDAPDVNYLTYLASGGASHAPSSLYLGNNIDLELDGQPTPFADGDDANGVPDDEDGIAFTTALIAGAPASIQVTVTGAGGILQGWIDWNADGDWLDASENPIPGATVSTGLNTVNFSVPNFATNIPTYARFRLSSSGGLGSAGPASDGEVEDYLIDLEDLKWLQIPEQGTEGVDVNNKEFMLADDFVCTASGPITDIHIWGSFLGDILPMEGLYSLIFDLSIWSDVPAGTDGIPYSRPGQMLWSKTYLPSAAGHIYTGSGEWWYEPGQMPPWIFPGDFNIYQFDFYPLPSEAFIQVEGNIYWLAMKYRYEGMSDIKFGWKTTPDKFNDDACYYDPALAPVYWKDMHYDDPTHPRYQESLELAFALSGNEVDVEDWGDAPDPTYPTLTGSTGARHIIVTNFFLGARIDAEMDGQPTVLADGDDIAVFDDEDGVTMGSLIRGSNTAVSVFLTSGIGNGKLDAWVDFNRNGIWANTAPERIFSSATLTPGANALFFPVPSGAVLGTNYARFRLSTAGGLSAGGASADGEVEDYLVTVHQPSPSPDILITNLFFTASNTVAQVEWNSQSGITYQMQSTTNLMISNSWMNVGGYVLGPINWQTNSAVPTNQFYRVTAPWTP